MTEKRVINAESFSAFITRMKNRICLMIFDYTVWAISTEIKLLE